MPAPSSGDPATGPIAVIARALSVDANRESGLPIVPALARRYGTELGESIAILAGYAAAVEAARDQRAQAAAQEAVATERVQRSYRDDPLHHPGVVAVINAGGDWRAKAAEVAQHMAAHPAGVVGPPGFYPDDESLAGAEARQQNAASAARAEANAEFWSEQHALPDEAADTDTSPAIPVPSAPRTRSTQPPLSPRPR